MKMERSRSRIEAELRGDFARNSMRRRKAMATRLKTLENESCAAKSLEDLKMEKLRKEMEEKRRREEHEASCSTLENDYLNDRNEYIKMIEAEQEKRKTKMESLFRTMRLEVMEKIKEDIDTKSRDTEEEVARKIAIQESENKEAIKKAEMLNQQAAETLKKLKSEYEEKRAKENQNKFRTIPPQTEGDIIRTSRRDRPASMVGATNGARAKEETPDVGRTKSLGEYQSIPPIYFRRPKSLRENIITPPSNPTGSSREGQVTSPATMGKPDYLEMIQKPTAIYLTKTKTSVDDKIADPSNTKKTNIQDQVIKDTTPVIPVRRRKPEDRNITVTNSPQKKSSSEDQAKQPTDMNRTKSPEDNKTPSTKNGIENQDTPPTSLRRWKKMDGNRDNIAIASRKTKSLSEPLDKPQLSTNRPHSLGDDDDIPSTFFRRTYSLREYPNLPSPHFKRRGSLREVVEARSRRLSTETGFELTPELRRRSIQNTPEPPE